MVTKKISRRSNIKRRKYAKKTVDADNSNNFVKDLNGFTYADAHKVVGVNNLPSIYDLSKVRAVVPLKQDSYVNFWSSEYLGIAPEDHPLEGDVILAKMTCVDGVVKISSEDFTSCSGLVSYKKAAANGVLNCGRIIDFKKKDGFYVPVTKVDKHKGVSYGNLTLQVNECYPIAGGSSFSSVVPYHTCFALSSRSLNHLLSKYKN